MKEYIIINPAMGGVARTIRAEGMGRQGNAFRKDGFANTFIMERERILVNGTEDGLPRAVRATYGKTKTSAALCGYNSKPTLVMERETEPKMIQNPHGFQQGAVLNLAPTVTSNSFAENNFVTTQWRIRKLTTREVFRLMDVDDEDIDKIFAAGIPKT